MIDWQRVNALRDEIGEEDFEEVVPLFLEEVSEIIDALQVQADLLQLEANLHSLKGSAVNLGFIEFSKLCHDGEMKAAAGNHQSVDVAEVVACFETSKTACIGGLAQGKAA